MAIRTRPASRRTPRPLGDDAAATSQESLWHPHTPFPQVSQFVAEYLETPGLDINLWDRTFSESQLITRSAKRRKMTITPVVKNQAIISHGGAAVGYVQLGGTALISDLARQALETRTLTHDYLSLSGVPVPRRKAFSPSERSQGAEHLNELGAPVLLKPETGGTVGRIVGGNAGQAFDAAWTRLVEEAAPVADAGPQIVIEEYLQGLNLRVYAVGEEIKAAVARLPRYVITHAAEPLAKLVEDRLAQYGKSFYGRGAASTQCDCLGSDPAGSPAPGTMLTIAHDPADLGNAVTVDVTDLLSPELRTLVLDALWAFPGLDAAAIDIVCESPTDAEGAAVVGVDPYCDIREFRYPMFGRARRPQEALTARMMQLGTTSSR